MEAAASRTTLCVLPLALLQSVLARLPVDARARACVVCRAWNVALAEHSLWARLDLSPASGVALAVTDAVLRAAAARASGQLEALDLTDCDVSCDSVLAVVTASGGTLRELRWRDKTRWRDNPSRKRRYLKSTHAEALLRAAPWLRMFVADVGCDTVTEASRLLRNEPPCAPLRVHALLVKAHEAEPPNEAALLAFAAAVAGHAWLAELTLRNVPLNAAASLDALLDAVLARRLRTVELWRCQLSPASAPAYMRLLCGGLARLALGDLPALFDAPAMLLLSNALRASTTLTSFQLGAVGLWRHPAAAVILLGALVGHPSLRELDVSHNTTGTPALQAIAGALLAALVVANAPALRTLNTSHCRLGDAGLGLLVDALPQNNHLRMLVCERNEITEGFVRNRLRPAVQANASLRKLVLFREPNNPGEEPPAVMRELQELVAARGEAGAPQ
jgi:hypothetical protein